MSASPVGVPARFGALLDRLPSPLVLGTVATVLIATSSFGAGAIRNRGGVLDALGLNVLAYGHAAGVCGSILWLGIFLLVAAWILAGRRTVFAAGAATDVAGGDARDVGNLTRTFLGPLADDRRLGAVVRGTTAWTLPLLLAAPILSRDVYSYLMQGAMLRDGFDPYTQGAAANPGPMLLEVSHDWRNTTTPYGPLHLWLGEGITRLVGDHVTAGVVLYKLVSVAGMAAILWAVPRIAARLGADPALATWLGVANPVLVLHMVGGMHNESLMVGLVSLGLVAALDRRFVAGVAIIAVAVSLKATAAIALPFVVWLATRHLGTRLTRRADGAASTGAADLPLSAIPRGRVFAAFLGAGAACTAGTVAVISLVTWASGASWGWLAEISGNSKVINPLSLPSLLAGLVTDSVRVLDDSFTFNEPLGVFRTIGSVLMLLGLVVVWWLFRENDRQAVRGIAVAYAVAFVFNAVSLPWYYASLLTLVAVTPVPRALVQWTAGASVVLAVAFTGSGNHQLYNVAFMAIAALCAWVAVGALAVPDRSPVNAAPTRGVGKRSPARPGAEKAGAGRTDAGAR
ncbi:alpha-(1-_6)-mannopyranosyltransferase A [Corynebacterium frankenforstense]|uniref:alpha-(1->6)-mannopyranosyltransferase A n=1 Tax=Corynebacterium frankenforstense TaxID=1230998 RepID=UPI0026EE033F|nr:alpha-(1->6)-mannopyranosyltransferase A [Corynebacterium frankenforstense]